jgi:hypothetical protein
MKLIFGLALLCTTLRGHSTTQQVEWQETEYFVMPVPFRRCLDGFVRFKVAYNQPLTANQKIVLSDLVYRYIHKVLHNTHRITYISSGKVYKHNVISLEQFSCNLTDIARAKGIDCQLRIVSCKYLSQEEGTRLR